VSPDRSGRSEPLFSHAWFDRARELARDAILPCLSQGTITVEYRATLQGGDVTHHQVFAGGRLAAWSRGPGTSPDLILRQTMRANLALLLRSGLGDGVLGETRVLDPGSGEACPPPPLDEVELDWGSQLPMIPTAGDLVVQQVLTDSPFGTLSLHHRLHRGQVAASAAGRVGRADVTVMRRYGSALRERAGDLDVLDSIEHGSIEGDFRKMALLLGIYDSDECRDARRALTRPWLGALVALGEVLSSPAWKRVASALWPSEPAGSPVRGRVNGRTARRPVA
jgi:hypothetical protein